MTAAAMGNLPSGKRSALWHLGPEDDPLEALMLAHDCQRVICAGLEALAASNIPDPALAQQVLDFLRDDLPLHFADEEESLFPILRRRAAPEDEIDSCLARLCADHGQTTLCTDGLLEVLARLAAGEMAGPKCRALLMTQADHERRHLMMENAIVLPLARIRLTRADIRSLRRMMRQRRGLTAGPPL